MNAQELFDKVLAHSRTMTEKSQRSEDGRCMYRDGKGGECFIGCLLPDDKYTPNMDRSAGAREHRRAV